MSAFAYNVDRKALLFIVFNVLSSIAIVLGNKWCFEAYNFRFGIFLTLCHFLTTWLGLAACSLLGVFTVRRLDWRAVLPLASLFCGFVVLTNLSLQHNSVGFYQLAKVMTTPTILLINRVRGSADDSMGAPLLCSLAAVVVGVILASVTDVQLNLSGFVFAAAGVLVTSFYQIGIKARQRALDVNSMQLLFYQAPLASALIVVYMIGAEIFEPSGLLDYEWSAGAVVAVAVTCALAFCVNLSIFMLIGRTSPITYNVVGHFKLCFVLAGGFLLFNYPLNPHNLAGVAIAFGGIVLYTHLKLQVQANVDAKDGKDGKDGAHQQQPKQPKQHENVEKQEQA
jgi:solute carrier family 35, member E3